MDPEIKHRVASSLLKHVPRLWTERELRFRPNHFEPEFWLVPLCCTREKLAVDVGANMGHYSYFMAKWSDGVVSFEPNTDLWPHLRKLLGPSARLESAALSASEGMASFRVDPSNTGVATIEDVNQLVCVNDPALVQSRTVFTRTLDSFNLSNIAMIKIDVEGHEESVIAGARSTLERNRPALLIESEDRHNPGAPRRLVSTLAAQGFSAFFLKNGRLLDYEELRAEETDPANLGAHRLYVNNFLFVPQENSRLVERIRLLLDRTQGALHLAAKREAVPAS